MHKPLKSLHISNVANMAYEYCKLLEQLGYPVELRCHNIRHIMSQPEWDDLELTPDDFPDENNFYNNQANFGNYQRPSWFHSDTLVAFNHPSLLFINKIIPHTVKEKLKPIYYRLWQYYHDWQVSSKKAEATQLNWQAQCEKIIVASKKYEQRWHLTQKDCALFLPQASWLSKYENNCDVLVGYMYAPIFAMFLMRKPLVSVEIGTIRDIPFTDTSLGKLLAMAYRRSSHVMITNPDGKIYAEQLGLENYSFCPHPVDEDIYKPVTIEERLILQQSLQWPKGYDYYMLAPARQNWEVKGNDKYLQAFAKLRADGINVGLIVTTWGQEIQRSKRLCDQLGVSAHVFWKPPVSERLLIKYFQASDLVVDQFNLGVFGLITPKALACGVPVFTSYNESVHDWCFKKHPPLIRCDSSESIYEKAKELLLNNEMRYSIGVQGRNWIETYHSKNHIVKAFSTILEKAKDHYKSALLV